MCEGIGEKCMSDAKYLRLLNKTKVSLSAARDAYAAARTSYEFVRSDTFSHGVLTDYGPTYYCLTDTNDLNAPAPYKATFAAYDLVLDAALFTLATDCDILAAFGCNINAACAKDYACRVRAFETACADYKAARATRATARANYFAIHDANRAISIAEADAYQVERAEHAAYVADYSAKNMILERMLKGVTSTRAEENAASRAISLVHSTMQANSESRVAARAVRFRHVRDAALASARKVDFKSVPDAAYMAARAAMDAVVDADFVARDIEYVARDADVKADRECEYFTSRAARAAVYTAKCKAAGGVGKSLAAYDAALNAAFGAYSKALDSARAVCDCALHAALAAWTTHGTTSSCRHVNRAKTKTQRGRSM